MQWRSLMILPVLLFVSGCSRPSRSNPPVSTTPQTSVSPQPDQSTDGRPPLAEQIERINRISQLLIKTDDKAAYKKAWDELLPAVDAALNHPNAWSLTAGALPLTVAVNEPDYRVYYKEGYYQSLGNDPTRTNFWVQWRDGAGAVHAQVLYRASGHLNHEARAYGPLLLISFNGDGGAYLDAWQLQGNSWKRAAVADTGDLAVMQTAEGLRFVGTWWRQLSADGTRSVYGTAGVPHLCPSFDSPAVLCSRLQVQGGRVSFVAPDKHEATRLSDPSTLKANLSVGYVDTAKPSAEPEVNTEASKRARLGLSGYLKLPLSQQMSPAAFEGFFKGTAPGSVKVLQLAPNVRVYSMITRPTYQPEAIAWVQWWTDPAKPFVQQLETDPFNTLYDAALFGPENDRVLIYTHGTFPTRHYTGRAAVALRLDTNKQTWVEDSRAFAADLPKAVGGVALSRSTGAVLRMYRPDSPPMSNKLELKAQKQTLTICDTDQLCVVLQYKGPQFVVGP